MVPVALRSVPATCVDLSRSIPAAADSPNGLINPVCKAVRNAGVDT